MAGAWFASVPVSGWRSHLRAHRDEIGALFARFVRAKLDAFAPGDLLAWDRELGRMFAEVDPDRTHCQMVFGLRDERALRRWCWAPGWVLMEQDEDLLLMGAESAPTLIEEAGLGCPKRDYALSIVAHGLRDWLHHALWPQEGASREQVLAAVDAALARAEVVVPLARAARAEALLAYAERLAGYRRPHPVDREEVEQRVYDVRRCYPSPEQPAVVRRERGRFVAELSRANVAPGELLVDADTGGMWANETARGRR